MKNQNQIQIPVEELNSSEIQKLAELGGATHVTELGWTRIGDGPEDVVTAYQLNDRAKTVVISTSGGLLTEPEEGYYETLELILGDGE